MPEKRIHTAAGDIPAAELGRTLIHEHLIFGRPEGAERVTPEPQNADEAVEKIVPLLVSLKERGIDSLLDATPSGFGRDAALLRRLSEASGVNILLTSGFLGEPERLLSPDGATINRGEALRTLTAFFEEEVTSGLDGTDTLPAVLKIGTGAGRITPAESVGIEAVGGVAARYGCSVITHCQEGTMGLEQAELLMSCGVPAEHIMIGHLNDITDFDRLRAIADTGVYLGFDRNPIKGLIKGTRVVEYSELSLDFIARLFEIGHGDRVMMSHDCACCIIAGGKTVHEKWWLEYIPDVTLPLLQKRGLGREELDTVFIKNPADFLGR